MAKSYYKLGEKASMFFDPSTGVILRPGEVLEFDKPPKSKKFSIARNGGHVIAATKEEFEACEAGKNADGALGGAKVLQEVEEDEAPVTKKEKAKLTPEEEELKAKLMEMESLEDIVEYFKEDGWVEDDLEKLNAKLGEKKKPTPAQFVKLALEINREYKD